MVRNGNSKRSVLGRINTIICLGWTDSHHHSMNWSISYNMPSSREFRELSWARNIEATGLKVNSRSQSFPNNIQGDTSINHSLPAAKKVDFILRANWIANRPDEIKIENGFLMCVKRRIEVYLRFKWAIGTRHLEWLTRYPHCRHVCKAIFRM
jgi:hypothetical protein